MKKLFAILITMIIVFQLTQLKQKETRLVANEITNDEMFNVLISIPGLNTNNFFFLDITYTSAP